MEKMTLTQLKNEIALKIRDDKLNNFLSLEDVTNKVVKKIQESGDFKELIPELENPIVAKPTNGFPQEEELEDNMKAYKSDQQTTPEPSPDFPTSTDVSTPVPVPAPIVQAPTEPEPATSYTPELPDIIKNVESGKLIVFDYAELDEPGENLAIKPFRTYDNPDVKKSIKDMWLSEAQRGADIYVAKFEKVGELTFDYINGVANFEKTPAEPIEPAETVTGDYKENPYKTEPTPQMMQTAVDVEKVAEKIIMDLLRKSLGLGGGQKTIVDPTMDGISNIVEPATVNIPGVDNIPQDLPIRADNQKDQPEDVRITDGHDNPDEIGFVVSEGVKLNDLIKIKSNFNKINTPKSILEALTGKNDKVKIIQETKEVNGWELDGIKYYLPTNHLSIRKCYIKK